MLHTKFGSHGYGKDPDKVAVNFDPRPICYVTLVYIHQPMLQPKFVSIDRNNV